MKVFATRRMVCPSGAGLGDRAGADLGGAAAAIVDQERLAKTLADRLRHCPGHDVGSAAGGIRNDHADRLRRRPLRRSRRNKPGDECKRGQSKRRPSSLVMRPASRTAIDSITLLLT